MSILELAKKVGTGIFESVVPNGGLILDGLNAVLPDDYKFRKGATGKDVLQAIERMPPELRQQIELKKIDLEIEKVKSAGDALQTMLVQDALTPQSTRPKIAWWSFVTVSLISVIFVLIYGYAVLSREPEMVTAVNDGWVMIVAIVAPFVVWLNAYFGVLKQEQANKLNASQGMPVDAGGIISELLKLKGK